MSKADFTVQQAAIAPAVAELDKPEIKAGQVWRCRDGELREVSRWRNGDLAYRWAANDGKTLTKSGREYGIGVDGGADLIELIKDENGFTIWRGGEPPAAASALVLVRLRSGTLTTRLSPVSDLRWDHQESPGDIVAYKVVEEAKASLTGSPDGADALAYGISQSDIAAIDKSFEKFAGADLGAENDAREYTGGKVNYYEVPIEHPTREGRAPYIAECNDIIEALDMSFAEGEAFKAIWRGAAARKNLAKRGYTDGLYDAEKVQFYGGRMVLQEKSRREKSSSKD